jgi:hypothetical protein
MACLSGHTLVFSNYSPLVPNEKQLILNTYSENSSIQSFPFELSPSLKKDIERSVRFKLTDKFNMYQILDTKSDSKIGTAIVCNYIGKHQPITFLIKLTKNGLYTESVSVLAYREDIGGQIKHPLFLAQFKNKSLNDPIQINHDIDGITGATLSARSTTWATKSALAVAGSIKKLAMIPSATEEHH